MNGIFRLNVFLGREINYQCENKNNFIKLVFNMKIILINCNWGYKKWQLQKVYFVKGPLHEEEQHCHLATEVGR